MKLKKFAFLPLIFAFICLSASAIPARRDVRTVRQPDGIELRVKTVGDEYMHFTLTEDGTLLYEDGNGFFTYGTLTEDGALVSTGVSATSSRADVKKLNIKDINIAELSEKRNIAVRRSETVPQTAAKGEINPLAAQSGYGLVSSTYSHFGSPKGLIILVEYSDVSFKLSNPAGYFHDLINGENFTQYGGTGSALQYFRDQSAGQFTPSFDVLGPVTLPQNRAYYGGHDAYGNDANPHLMVTHAIAALDATVDFSQYDTDGDGVIDNVYIFYAGEGEANGGGPDTVWPHSWDVRYGGVNLRVDGVLVGHYACSNEWVGYENRPDGIGTFVHEFSHVMGLPDLYHTQASVNYTPSVYSVMDYGCYSNGSRTPTGYTAYERNAMSWFEPIVLRDPATITLENITTGQFALIPTTKNSEFFLLENRQLTGWDRYLPGHGMLIWHIDYNANVFASNVVNNNQSHQYVDIEEANNNPNSSSATVLAGWPFPGTTGRTSFTATTTPSLTSWSGVAIDLPITEITEQGGLITFNVKGGASPLSAPAPTAEVNEGAYFTAKWAPVEGATDYFVTVYAAEGAEKGTSTIGFDGSSVGNGWTASSADYYTTANNFGESSPSFKFGTDGQTLTSPELPAPVTSIQFWSKGVTTNGTTLMIEGLTGEVWEYITTYTPLANRKETVELNDLPENVTRVRFTLNKGNGNIAVDDIVINYGGGSQLLPDYNGVSTAGATTLRVDKLMNGVRKYYFYVSATDGTYRSPLSDRVYVDLDDDSGVEEIVADEECPTIEYYNLQGIRIERPASGSLVIERRGNKVSKVIIP